MMATWWGPWVLLLAELVGLIVFFGVGALIWIRMHVKGCVWAEFIDGSRVTFELVKVRDGLRELEREHGVYQLYPDGERLLAKWPSMAPTWLQETVPHEIFWKGDKFPADLEIEVGENGDRRRVRLPLTLAHPETVSVSAVRERDNEKATQIAVRELTYQAKQASAVGGALEDPKFLMMAFGVTIACVLGVGWFLYQKLEAVIALLGGL